VDAPLDIDWLNEPMVYNLIQTFDIGVAPLLDTEFNRAKSAFKLKQCLSCGIPVLASRIGENKRFLKHGINGYFCDHYSQYKEKILLMRSEPYGRYSAMSQNALASADDFNLDYYCDTLMDYISQKQKVMAAACPV
jgi:glycosyltransferase involved in cell wall biosynthesis